MDTEHDRAGDQWVVRLTRAIAVPTALLALGVAPLDEGGGGHDGHEDGHEHEHGEGGPAGLVNGLLGLVLGSS